MGVQWCYEKAFEVDVSLVNAYISKKGYSGVDLRKYHELYERVNKSDSALEDPPKSELVYQPITNPFKVFEMDFNRRPVQLEGQLIENITTINSGKLTSFVFWFDLELVPGVELSSSPFIALDDSRRVCIIPASHNKHSRNTGFKPFNISLHLYG